MQLVLKVQTVQGNTRHAGNLLELNLQAFDTTGGQTFSTSAITLNLDTTTASNGSAISLASDEFTISTAGDYLFKLDVSTKCESTSGRSVAMAFIERQPSGGAYAEVDGTRAFMYNRNSTAGDQTGSVGIVLSVSANDKYRVRLIRDAGTDTLETIADGSRLVIGVCTRHTRGSRTK